jgi:cardiolipin synthase
MEAEMNVEIKSTAFASSYLEHLNEVIAQCQTITHKSLKKRNNISSSFINWLSYWAARLILNIVTYFPQNRFKNFTDLSVCFLVLVSTTELCAIVKRIIF